MAGTSDIAALLRVPGRLCINPTTLTGAFPGNGTSLGLVKAIDVDVNTFTEPVSEEGLGTKIIIDALDMGEQWGISAILRAADQGVIQRFFSASKAGASTGANIVVSPGVTASPAVQPGAWIGLSAVKLVFWPNDPVQWFVYFPRALCNAIERAKLAKSIRRDFGVPVVFTATPPVAGGLETVQWGPREDLVL